MTGTSLVLQSTHNLVYRPTDCYVLGKDVRRGAEQHHQKVYYHNSGNAKSTSNAKWFFTTAEHAALLIPLGLKIYVTTSIQGHFFHKEK